MRLSYPLNQASMGKVSITLDVWSDQNLRPFVAMTAHWIAKIEGTTAIQLKTALIAFHRLYGRHDGETLAQTVVELLDRAEITTKVRLLFMSAITTMHVSDFSLKIGHFTMDNAGNNGTMMRFLQKLLKEREVTIDPDDRRIMCFAHVVDLSSGRVVRKVDDAVDNNGGDLPQSDNEAGPITRGRNVVRAIRGSGMRRDAFDEAIENGNAKNYFTSDGGAPVVVKSLQLLRDVRTRWDSTYHMLSRLREMRPVWFYF
jgi:hypothetical protein